MTTVANVWVTTTVMVEKFAGVCGMVGSEFLDLNQTSRPWSGVPYDSEVRWTLAAKVANFGMGH